MKIKQRLFRMLLCGAMLVSLCVPAAAEETGSTVPNVPYLNAQGAEQTCPSAPLVTDSDTGWENGWYVMEGTVNIGRCATVTGNVHLILKDGCELQAKYGISLKEGASLTICAQSDGGSVGKLSAHYNIIGNYDAGIEVNAGSTVTINGGTVTATSIGGGYDGTSGTFSTGTNGSAIITTVSIADIDSQGSWQGVFFIGNGQGQVCGSPTLTTDMTIPAGTTLEIPEGTSLAIGEGATLNNNGIIRNSGTLKVEGTLKNDEVIVNHGTLNNYGLLTNNSIIISDSEIGGTITGNPAHVH